MATEEVADHLIDDEEETTAALGADDVKAILIASVAENGEDSLRVLVPAKEALRKTVMSFLAAASRRGTTEEPT